MWRYTKGIHPKKVHTSPMGSILKNNKLDKIVDNHRHLWLHIVQCKTKAFHWRSLHFIPINDHLSSSVTSIGKKPCYVNLNMAMTTISITCNSLNSNTLTIFYVKYMQLLHKMYHKIYTTLYT